MPASKLDDMAELVETYADWIMDKINAKSHKEAIDREAMSAAALFVGVTGLVGDGSTPEQWDRLGGVATDLVDEVLLLIHSRMSSLKLSDSEGRR